MMTGLSASLRLLAGEHFFTAKVRPNDVQSGAAQRRKEIANKIQK
jgi:hypothetical protein